MNPGTAQLAPVRSGALGLLAALLAGIGATGCDESDSVAAMGPSSLVVAITVSKIHRVDLERVDSSAGHLEAKNAPMIAAEVAGSIYSVSVDVGDRVVAGQELATIDPEDYRLKKGLAQAEIERVRSLIRSQVLQVRRFSTLVRKKSINQSVLDQAAAELGALNAQLMSAEVQLQRAQRDLDKSRIISPIDGSVDHRQVSAGDFVEVGMPLFHLTSLAELQVRLPYPETSGSLLRRGLGVRLTSPAYPGMVVEGTVSQVRPIITPENRSLDLIVDLLNPGRWEPGASVIGEVIIEIRPGALMVPDISVVRRPEGTVVYVIEEGVASSRIVTTGLRRGNQVEILDGLTGGEMIAMDGAAFLADGARVEIKVS
ncbi:MAG: efflux RND transporter periplasmic adaptor subunit [Pseudomonadales bacterium]